jgi:hypothetical protein
MAQYGYHGGYSGDRNPGLEAALQHIEDAKRLSEELGGTDKDVKEYFFNLPPDQLRKVLGRYAQRFGRSKREYAEQTMADWRSGRVHMSGLVAERLYSLLPPLMPLTDKYSLTESLWKHVCPSTHKVLVIGANADQQQIINVVREYAAQTVQGYFIQDGLAKRFKWLSAGDIQVQQQLMNHLLEMEKQVAVSALHEQLPVLMGHMRRHGSVTTHLQQTIQLGKHRIDLRFEANGSEVRMEEPRRFRPGRPGTGAGADLTWLWWVIGIAAVIAFFALR